MLNNFALRTPNFELLLLVIVTCSWLLSPSFFFLILILIFIPCLPAGRLVPLFSILYSLFPIPSLPTVNCQPPTCYLIITNFLTAYPPPSCILTKYKPPGSSLTSNSISYSPGCWISSTILFGDLLR